MSYKKYVSGLGVVTLPDWTLSVRRKTVIVGAGSLERPSLSVASVEVLV